MDQKVYYERKGVTLLAPILPGYEGLLTDDFLDLVGQVTRAHREEWRQLMAARQSRQARYDQGAVPNFDSATKLLRDDSWQVAPIPGYLQDRAVEIVLPANNTKFAVGALNKRKEGVPIVLLDIEDSLVCSWKELLKAFLNVQKACDGTLTYRGEQGTVALDDETTSIMVRPRGLHFIEPHVLVDDDVVPAFYFDVTMHTYHNALALLRRGQGADLYLAKLEHGEEAKHCNSVISLCEYENGLPDYSSKVSVLFEHINGLFQIEEIIYALQERFVAGNTGWLDYLASLSRVMRCHDEYVMPDPSTVTVRTPCMAAYLDLVRAKCHQRGAMAIGGTATHVAVRGDEAKTAQALRSVLDNAAPYTQGGFDGGWVVYAPFAPRVAAYFREAFVCGQTNQLRVTRLRTEVTAQMLLEPPHGKITIVGIQECIIGGISYYAGWLDEVGAVAIDYPDADGNFRCRLMEDAATGQRKREDLWKWLRLDLIQHDAFLREVAKFLEPKEYELGESFEKSSWVEASVYFLKDIFSDEPPPDYFPPELLGVIQEREQKEFALFE